VKSLSRIARPALLALALAVSLCAAALALADTDRAAALTAGSKVISGRALAPPSLTAREAILVETDTGAVAYASHADLPVAIASTTKLMTAYLVLHSGPLDRRLPALFYPAAAGESTVGLQPGERLSVADLLRGMLLASGNDAAYTLAVRIGGSEAAFVTRMNSTAARLGLRHTHYSTPIGLDTAGNYSTAADLARLTEIDLSNGFFAHTVAEPRAILHTGSRPRAVINRNDLVGQYPFVVGVKTGHTRDAGYVLVGAGAAHGVHLVSVVLGDPDLTTRDADSLALLRYGLARYRRVKLVSRGQTLARVPIHFAGGWMRLVAERALERVLSVGDHPAVMIRAPRQLTGPLRAGSKAGSVFVSLGGHPVAQVALITAQALSSPTLGQRLRTYFSHTATIVLLVVLLVCSLLLALLRRRAMRSRSVRRPSGHEQ
jgi:serine-type D-Ala-D-Ala carboxypeptidase (penicillin-binding protein 5/6)